MSLQNPKSIAQVVSLAETIEIMVKVSRRPTSKAGSGGNQSKGSNQSNLGRGFGVVEAVVGEGEVEVEGIWGIPVEEVVEQLEDEVDKEE